MLNPFRVDILIIIVSMIQPNKQHGSEHLLISLLLEPNDSLVKFTEY